MKKIITVTLLLAYTQATAQILNDTEYKQLVITALDKIYNFEFTAAQPIIQKIKTKYANHPLTPLMNTMVIQWQNLDISKNPKVANVYKQNMDKCLEYADKLMMDKDKFPEAVFLNSSLMAISL